MKFFFWKTTSMPVKKTQNKQQTFVTLNTLVWEVHVVFHFHFCHFKTDQEEMVKDYTLRISFIILVSL